MRKHKKEITDRATIDAVIHGSRVCRLGMSDEGQPYVVPLCFGYDGECVYFHCAWKGRKLDILRKNPRVCLEFDLAKRVIESEHACGWDMEYQSVIGFGTAEIIDDVAEKEKALHALMTQYSDREFSFPEAKLKLTAVIKVSIDTLSGKQAIFS